MTNFNVDLSAQIGGDLIALLDDWHSLPETWDSDLDAQIHAWYANPPKVFPKRPYFSPSSVNDCPRELFLKNARAKRDVERRQPHQGRWVRIGTVIGDVIQRDLLFIEKHYEAKTGNKPRFKFLRTKDGQPAFEDFAKINKRVEHRGETFYLFGAPDGIMSYTTDNGEEIRVGLEVKSKQTTPARTSLYSMRNAEESHVAQTTAYAHMFGCDYYIVLYVNAAKQSWNLTDEQRTKTPDIRAFCRKVTEEDKAELLDKLALQTRAQRLGEKPPLDIEKWLFNNYKEACALDLSDEEYRELVQINERMQNSSLPGWKKQGYAEAIEFIKTIRSTTRSEGER